MYFGVDIDDHRLSVAKAMGATYTVKVTTRDSRVMAEQIRSTLGCSPDHTLECSGAEPSIGTAIYVSQSILTPFQCSISQYSIPVMYVSPIFETIF